MKNYFLLKQRIKKNEGFKRRAYTDSLGFKTIGYGHLIKKNEIFFLQNDHSKTDLSRIFELDFNKALKIYSSNYKNKKYVGIASSCWSYPQWPFVPIVNFFIITRERQHYDITS